MDQISSTSTFIALIHLPQPMPMDFWDVVPYDQIPEENASLDNRWICTICWYHLKVDSCSILQAHSHITGWRKILLVGRTSSSIFGCPPCPESERWPEIWIYTYSWKSANGLSGWSGIWKKLDWKIGDKEVWGRSMWMVLWIGTDYVDTSTLYEYPPEDIHYRGISQWQMDKTTNSYDVSLSPQPCSTCSTGS